MRTINNALLHRVLPLNPNYLPPQHLTIMSTRGITPNGSCDEPSSKRPRLEESTTTNGLAAAVADPGPSSASIKLDATIGTPSLETKDFAPEVFVTLHMTHAGKTHDVVLAESDRYIRLSHGSNIILNI